MQIRSPQTETRKEKKIVEKFEDLAEIQTVDLLHQRPTLQSARPPRRPLNLTSMPFQIHILSMFQTKIKTKLVCRKTNRQALQF